jgi:NAD(P)-dependent dehydrogenase (short-subunit alcohol dehydrogenase family)
MALAAEGRPLALLDIDRERLVAVGDEVLAHGADGVHTAVADVTSEDDVARAVADAVARHGPPVATFANAGIEVNRATHEMDRATWEHVIAVNLTGVFLTVKHALAALRVAGTRGAIVCTSSPSAFFGFAGGGNAAYGASKGGIASFVKSVAIDYAPYGIRVNAVIPGAIDTPLIAATPSIGEPAAEQIPLGRLGRADEVADVVTWLLSERASYVTGTAVVCDGGLTARSVNEF